MHFNEYQHFDVSFPLNNHNIAYKWEKTTEKQLNIIHSTRKKRLV
jgi:hypothetical protein